MSPVDGTTHSMNPSKLAGQLERLPPHLPANLAAMRRPSSRVIPLFLAAGVALTGCSSTERLAAPAEDAGPFSQSVGGFTPETKT